MNGLTIIAVVAFNFFCGNKVEKGLPYFRINGADTDLRGFSKCGGESVLGLRWRLAGSQACHQLQTPPTRRSVESVTISRPAPRVQFRTVLQWYPKVG